jgi:hypothetical protein
METTAKPTTREILAPLCHADCGIDCEHPTLGKVISTQLHGHLGIVVYISAGLNKEGELYARVAYRPLGEYRRVELDYEIAWTTWKPATYKKMELVK